VRRTRSNQISSESAGSFIGEAFGLADGQLRFCTH